MLAIALPSHWTMARAYTVGLRGVTTAGAIDSTGADVPPGYYVGVDQDGKEVRDFFVLDGAAGITAAYLYITQPHDYYAPTAYGYTAKDASVTYTLHGVSPGFTTGKELFDNIGNGPIFGTAIAKPGWDSVIVQLNSAALAALGSTSRLVIGGVLSPLGGPGEGIFANSPAGRSINDSVSFVYTDLPEGMTAPTPAPVPPALPLMAGALATLGLLRRRKA